MGERFRRFTDSQVRRDPDVLRNASRFLHGVRPFFTERRYAGELLGVGNRWLRVDQPQEALTAFDQVVAMRGDRVHDRRAKALAGQALCRCGINDYAGAIPAAEEAVRLLEPLAAEKPGRYGHALLVARWSLAMGHYGAGQLVRSVPALVRWIRMARVAPLVLDVDLPNALAILTSVLHRLSVPSSAEVALYPEAIEILGQLGAEDPRVADVLGWSVEPLGDAGLLAEARAAGAEAIARYRKLGDEAKIAEVQRDLDVLSG